MNPHPTEHGNRLAKAQRIIDAMDAIRGELGPVPAATVANLDEPSWGLWARAIHASAISRETRAIVHAICVGRESAAGHAADPFAGIGS